MRIFALLLTFWGAQAVACPDVELWGHQQYTLSGGEMYRPQYFDVVAGGENELQTECGRIYRRLQSDRGTGFFATRPDFTIDASGLNRYRLEIAVSAGCDTSLLINTATGSWYFDDDDGPGVNPKITLTNPQNGLIDIWVGTYGPRTCDSTLRLETFR